MRILRYLDRNIQGRAKLPSSSGNRFVLGCGALVFLGLFQLVFENRFISPVVTTLRGSAYGIDASTLQLEIAVNEAASQVNETLLSLHRAEEKIVELKNTQDADDQQINDLKKELEELKQNSHDFDNKQINDLKQKLEDSQKESKKHLDYLKAQQLGKEEELKAQNLALEEELKSQKKATPNLAAESNRFYDPNSVCSALPVSETSSSATRLWKEYLPRILEIARKSEIIEYQNEKEFAKLKTILEETLSPARMRRAIRHLPTFSHRILKHVMDIVQKRRQDPKNNPPLRIAVFGGSVTLGRECFPGAMGNKICAWPARFESLINQMFGNEIVKVYNLAIGGTNSESATNRIKYWMYGDETLDKEGADIIINSYSTNDSLPKWDLEWPKDDLIGLTSVAIHEKLQGFVRESLQINSCGIPPLVVHVDDYLGPQQPALLGELAWVKEMTQLSKWYDTVGISNAEVVRDIVYQDYSDNTFAGKTKGKRGRPIRGDAHFGHLGHQTIAWSVGFASLQLLLNYCDDEYNAARDKADAKEKGRRRNLLTKEEIKKDRLFLPPPLTRDLLQENVTAAFNAAMYSYHKNYVDNGCDAAGSNSTGVADKNPCMIAWISTPGNWGSTKIEEFMKKYQTENDGWGSERQNAEGWSNKDGWVAKKKGASMRLQFPNVSKEIRTVSIYFLRSYGEKWKDSKAKFTVYRLPAEDKNLTGAKMVSEMSIVGVHASEDYKYSLTRFESMRLNETITKGETLDLQIDLESGTTFKVMGMMLCNK